MVPSQDLFRGVFIVRPRLLGAAGFTLIEVTMAIGIIAFAFIGIFQLLPIGLGVSRQAIDTTIEAQIAQHMKTQALQIDFSQLSKLSTLGKIYFDDRGKPVDSATTAVYAGEFIVSNTTSLADNVQSSRLATVTVHIQSAKGNLNENGSRKFPIFIPDNGL